MSNVIELASQPNQHRSRVNGVYGHDPLNNQILHTLPRTDYQRLLCHLEFVSLPQGLVLYEPHKPIQNYYFPTSSIVSLVHETTDGRTAELLAIGKEGVLGVSVCVGSQNSLSRAIVTCGGVGFSLNMKLLSDEIEKGGALQYELLHYLQALIVQISLGAVCLRHHCIFQQLCRWLLQTLDRIPGSEIIMTQSMIADLLGVRRESITEAASRLQEQGLIRYTRGHLMVIDRAGIEDQVCECYVAMKNNLRNCYQM